MIGKEAAAFGCSDGGAGQPLPEAQFTQVLYGRLTPEMLLTADRGFYSFCAWQYASSTGAQLLWGISNINAPSPTRSVSRPDPPTLIHSTTRRTLPAQIPI